MLHYIGIDISKQDFTAFDGKKVRKFMNNPGLKKFDTYLNKRNISLDETVIIFEATGVYSLNLKYYCAEKKIKAFIVNPKRSSNFAKVCGNRSKTDKIDSKALYTFKNIIDSEKLVVPVIDQVSENLNSYLTSYKFIMKFEQATCNHLEALKHKRNVPKKLVSSIKNEIKRLNKLKNNIIPEAVQFIKDDPCLKEDFENLISIKSIGEKSAVCLLCLFKKYPNTNRAQITALSGLDPIKKESGTSVNGKMRISKNGFSMIRNILYFPTMNAIQHNPQIKKFYNRLIKNHKLHSVALIAAMKKLLLMAHAVYKNKTKYKIDNISTVITNDVPKIYNNEDNYKINNIVPIVINNIDEIAENENKFKYEKKMEFCT